MQNLFILGIKHSGKTTFARLIAERIGLKAIDSDDLIKEEIKPLTVREYYKSAGSDGFKKKEFEVVSSYLSENKEKSWRRSLRQRCASKAFKRKWTPYLSEKRRR